MRECFATHGVTGETLYRCPACGEMDGRITGIDVRWGKDVAYTRNRELRLGRLIRETPTAQIDIWVVCNECGEEQEIVLGEMIPDGILALSLGAHDADSDDE